MVDFDSIIPDPDDMLQKILTPAHRTGFAENTVKFQGAGWPNPATVSSHGSASRFQKPHGV
jgi:hypothetical protein